MVSCTIQLLRRWRLVHLREEKWAKNIWSLASPFHCAFGPGSAKLDLEGQTLNLKARPLVDALRGHSPIHDHRTLHGFRSNCPTSRGALSRRCLDGDSNLPHPDAFEPILVETLLPATQTTRFDLNSLGPAT